MTDKCNNNEEWKMSGSIKNTEMANDYATGIDNTLDSYEGNSLGVTDDTSTITANENCKNSFSTAQAVLGSFQEALVKDNGHIKTLAQEFEKFDKLIAERNKL